MTEKPTPLSRITYWPGSEYSVELYIKRDDLIHPLVQGNKWRKLHLTLERIRADGSEGVISYGGAFSNHLHALAYAGPIFGLKTVGILRGTSVDLDNPTLSDAWGQGMQLFPVNKQAYDLKENAVEVKAILEQFPGYTVIPEGGAAADGVLGCIGLGHELTRQIHNLTKPVYVAVAAGTGCTAAGLISGLSGAEKVLVFPAAPYGISEASIQGLISLSGKDPQVKMEIMEDYILGKFGRPEPKVLDFAREFTRANGILLDPLYTSRMLYGLYDLASKGFFPNGSTVVAVHTGGVQGWRGMA